MIETERLLLRPHTLSDFEDICAMFSDPEVVRYVGGMTLSKEEVWNRLLRYIGHWSVFGYGLFAITEKSSGRFLGDTGFADFHRYLGNEFDPFPEAAWILTSNCHGKGYGFEAASAAHAWFDTTHSPARTVCIIQKENQPSHRLAAKMGYQAFDEATYKGAIMTMYQRLRNLA
ncbi:GNAT family N-acetyltransferase [Luteolibacter luteus]|uniref:GNAT family N-acetyltransferase n=1 Tax=Luteolibacter luteus TaxID=2728835 RepID=A0A858RLY3_9BACT|nr:GNAT family N-acetyltransferase [Luteolibacter luteus]QJE98386.1 GNAT family N-acetyltransferase [Luteolibacter luteus]